MLALLAMAGSVVAALAAGLYLCISMGEEDVPPLAHEASDLTSAPGER
jgi:hypothetical protein